MKLIRPTIITEAMFTDSNLVEVPPAAYSAGTPYGAGDTASTGNVGGVITVWESLAAGNLNNAPASSPAWWQVAGYTYGIYVAGTTYGAGNIVLVEATHTIYESLVTDNLDNYPPTDVLEVAPTWKSLGPSNRWAMFDERVGTKTVQADSIEVVLEPGVGNSLGLLEVSGTEVVVVLTTVEDGEIFNHTESMVANNGINNWYAWHFEPVVRKTTVILFGLPVCSGSVLSVTITDTGADAECGVLVFGLEKKIGPSLYGLRAEISDWSKRITKEGITSIEEGPYSTRVSVDVRVARELTNDVFRLLAGYRAKAIIYVVDDFFEMAIAYGHFRNFSILVPSYNKCTCSLEIEGLI